jgi:putative ABC transport system ATP-binding protein
VCGLVAEGVCRGFARGRGGPWVQVLSGVSFDVQPGEVVGIVGARLSGKTTLLRVAAGLDAPEEGVVRLGASELTGLSDRERAALRGDRIVWVSRRGMSQRLEAVKIVGWPLARSRGRRETERRAAQMLERVGAAHCAGRRWGDLLPWEQVLVGLAQGFAGDPEIVVIDDLLDALGGRRTEEASDLLRTLVAEGGNRCGVLMSASDIESVLLADRVWSLEQGGKLIPTAGHHGGDADIIPFRASDQSGGPRRVGRL